jgi:hypothetical protein
MSAPKGRHRDETALRKLLMALDLKTLLIIGSGFVGAFGIGWAADRAINSVGDQNSKQIGLLSDNVRQLSDKMGELERRASDANNLTNARITSLEGARSQFLTEDANRRVAETKQIDDIFAQISSVRTDLGSQIKGVQQGLDKVQTILELGPESLRDGKKR